MSKYDLSTPVGRSLHLFSVLKEVEINEGDGEIVLRLRVGTDDWRRVMYIARKVKMTPAQTVRHMVRAVFAEMYWRVRRDKTD